MTKTQKIWMWIFIAMFTIPEILFFFTPLSILSFTNNFSPTNIKPIAYSFVNSQFFTDHPGYLLVAIIIEWLGALGLLIISFKSKKKIPSVMLLVVLLWLSFLIFVGYVLSTMSPIL
jgi:hypothetical protein